MNHLNSILIEGNLVRDPKQRTTQSGKTVCLLTLASNRYFKTKTNRLDEDGFEKEVSFFDIEAWGKLAEACCANGAKGRGIRVVGRLKQDRWNDGEGPHARIVVVAEHIEFRHEFRKAKQSEKYEVEQEDEVLAEQSERAAELILSTV